MPSLTQTKLYYIKCVTESDNPNSPDGLRGNKAKNIISYRILTVTFIPVHCFWQKQESIPVGCFSNSGSLPTETPLDRDPTE